MVIVIMGVAGSGKSTIGQALARDLGWGFIDADDLHPPANIERMRAGLPLTDADRAPWLAALRELIARCLAQQHHVVLAASLLKAAYREAVGVDQDQVRLVFLHADPTLIRQRLEKRQGHFMAAVMLDSQLATLEVPDTGLRVDASQPQAQIVTAIRRGVSL
ncbi:gluconokinase [Thermithiobacillus plumbiphilus]|uniref:Gluconokinase n=1 Tax=Thermithiobacillus plumbiphilus TaxID=1729899 RepID=A0ABU9D6D9_9PROT